MRAHFLHLTSQGCRREVLLKHCFLSK